MVVVTHSWNDIIFTVKRGLSLVFQSLSMETKFGENLKESTINEEGDFIYIPPGVSHKLVNLSETEPVLAIVSRNDPNEHENVISYDLK